MTLNEEKKSWRPKGWKNPYSVSVGGDARRADSYTDWFARKAETYEKGADAMLRALINQPSNIGANVLYVDELADGSTILHNFHRKGWLVFIPDEEYLLKPPHEG